MTKTTTPAYALARKAIELAVKIDSPRKRREAEYRLSGLLLGVAILSEDTHGSDYAQTVEDLHGDLNWAMREASRMFPDLASEVWADQAAKLLVCSPLFDVIR